MTAAGEPVHSLMAALFGAMQPGHTSHFVPHDPSLADPRALPRNLVQRSAQGDQATLQARSSPVEDVMG